jgi:hypothetical protein
LSQAGESEGYVVWWQRERKEKKKREGKVCQPVPWSSVDFESVSISAQLTKK